LFTDEPIRVIIYLYMKISQGNSLYNYFYLKQAKCHFSFFLLLQNWRIGGQNRSFPRMGRLVPVGGGKEWGKEVRG
jgi:hypothetical protein